jgi:hypothetical protein
MCPSKDNSGQQIWRDTHGEDRKLRPFIPEPKIFILAAAKIKDVADRAGFETRRLMPTDFSALPGVVDGLKPIGTMARCASLMACLQATRSSARST